VNTFAPALAHARQNLPPGVPVVDVDVHVNVPSIQTLLAYLDPHWRAFIAERQYAGPPGLRTVYPPGSPGTARPEWRPERGLPAASLATVRHQVLDSWRPDVAILHCYYAIDSCRHPDVAAALARAVNDWLIDEWLSRDSRLRASLAVPAHTFADAAAEIDRVGGHPGFVQVTMPARSMQPYGRRNWWPVYEAMLRHGLVMGLDWGGTSDGAPTPTGWPSWFAEEYAGELQVYMSQILSMLAEGTFEQYPELRVAVLGAGFSWVPSLIWRLDKEWRGLRRTIPWMRQPAETIRGHFRFCTSPPDLGPPAEAARLVSWLGTGMLMFGSDYPHAYHGDVGDLLEVIPAAELPAVLSGNATELYQL
jgi:predicted TIM-barrel fold metal-dependent hydrolase